MLVHRLTSNKQMQEKAFHKERTKRDGEKERGQKGKEEEREGVKGKGKEREREGVLE